MKTLTGHISQIIDTVKYSGRVIPVVVLVTDDGEKKYTTQMPTVGAALKRQLCVDARVTMVIKRGRVTSFTVVRHPADGAPYTPKRFRQDWYPPQRTL